MPTLAVGEGSGVSHTRLPSSGEQPPERKYQRPPEVVPMKVGQWQERMSAEAATAPTNPILGENGKRAVVKLPGDARTLPTARPLPLSRACGTRLDLQAHVEPDQVAHMMCVAVIITCV